MERRLALHGTHVCRPIAPEEKDVVKLTLTQKRNKKKVKHQKAKIKKRKTVRMTKDQYPVTSERRGGGISATSSQNF